MQWQQTEQNRHSSPATSFLSHSYHSGPQHGSWGVIIQTRELIFQDFRSWDKKVPNYINFLWTIPTGFRFSFFFFFFLSPTSFCISSHATSFWFFVLFCFFALVNAILPLLKFIWKLVFQKHFPHSSLWLQFSAFFLTNYVKNNLLALNAKAVHGLLELHLLHLYLSSIQIACCQKAREGENMSVCLALEAGNKLSAITLLVTVLPSFKYILQVWYLWIIQWCWDSRGTRTSAHSFAHSFLTAPSCFPSTFLTFTCRLIFPFKLINCLCRSNICLCICTVCSIMVPWPLGTITI